MIGTTGDRYAVGPDSTMPSRSRFRALFPLGFVKSLQALSLTFLVVSQINRYQAVLNQQPVKNPNA